MDTWGSRIVWGLVALAIIFGIKFYYKSSDSDEIRHAAYERYSELASPDKVRIAVDEHHDAAFDRAYRMGGRRSSASFNQEAYIEVLDGRVLRELGYEVPQTRLSVLDPGYMEQARAQTRARFDALKSREKAMAKSMREAEQQREREAQQRRRERERQQAERKQRRQQQHEQLRQTHARLSASGNQSKPSAATAAASAPAQSATRVQTPEKPKMVWDVSLAADAMTDDDVDQQTEAMQWIAEQQAFDDSARAKLAPSLIEALKTGSTTVKRAAIPALGALGDGSAVDPLIPFLAENGNATDRHLAMDALARLGDPKAAFPIARWIQLDTDYCEKTLIALGPDAESEVLKLLRFRKASVDVSICRILEKIGTGRSIRALTSKTRDQDARVRSAAESALAAVIERNRQRN